MDDRIDDYTRTKAVRALDRFTKLYCRNRAVTDDLVFRCPMCDFEAKNGLCLVKVMAHRLCPEYRDFGAMGDL